MGASAISTTRVRAGAIAAGALVVAAFCALCYLASRTTLTEGVGEEAHVEIWMTARPQTPAPARQAQASSETQPRAVAPAGGANADPVLAQMLACFNPRQRERRSDCPPSQPQQRAPDWRTRDQLPVGGDFVARAPIDFSAGLSRGEQLAGLQHEPPCSIDGRAASSCARLPPPPPPSRTAEEICMGGGLGPCHPPPAERVERAH